jgi:hypothetical protein
MPRLRPVTHHSGGPLQRPTPRHETRTRVLGAISRLHDRRMRRVSREADFTQLASWVRGEHASGRPRPGITGSSPTFTFPLRRVRSSLGADASTRRKLDVGCSGMVRIERHETACDGREAMHDRSDDRRAWVAGPGAPGHAGRSARFRGRTQRCAHRRPESAGTTELWLSTIAGALAGLLAATTNACFNPTTEVG